MFVFGAAAAFCPASAEPDIDKTVYSIMNSPVLFHPAKHHLGWLRGQLSLSDADFMALLPRIGANQMDVYTGKIGVDTICTCAVAFLAEAGTLPELVFREWLAAQGGYAQLSLPDSSVWVLRWSGEGKDAYVHLHPGRKSAHTRRAKAGAMKTALLAAHFSPEYLPDTQIINELRDFAGLSPLKSSEDLIWREWYELLIR